MSRWSWPSLRLWIGLAAIVLVVAVLAGPSGQNGEPLDPRSAGGTGTKALVLTMRQLGAEIDVTDALPVPGTDLAVVLADRLDEARRRDLVSWVKQGGTLVVADPRSDLQPSAPAPPPVELSTGFSNERTVRGPCPRAGLTDVGRLEVGPSLFLRPVPGEVGCFPVSGRRDGLVFLVAAATGRGRVVGLGGAALFTNDRLGHADNAILAADLLLPRPGARVALLEASPVGSGRRSLSSLVSTPVKLGLLELLLAFGALAAWRARRLGRPVVEAQPVAVAGSEIVVAVGNLMARTGRREQAAAALRDGFRRWLAQRAGLGPAASAGQVADAVSARTGASAEALRSVLSAASIADDGELVALAQSIERQRREVSRGPL